MVSIKVLVMLFCIGLLATKTSAVNRRCCSNYMKGRLPFAVIEGYSVQTDTQTCHISAIIFHTKKGKDFCAYPTLNWVMEYVNRLKNKALRVHMNAAQKPQ